MQKMKAVKKIVHSFMLLEVLIGLALLALCLMPFIHLPSKSLEKEFRILQELSLTHFSEEACALIKEQIYLQKIVLPLKEKKLVVLDDKISLPLQAFSKCSFSRKAVLTARHKKGKDGLDYFLLKLDLTFKNKEHTATFTHQFLVGQKNLREQPFTGDDK